MGRYWDMCNCDNVPSRDGDTGKFVCRPKRGRGGQNAHKPRMATNHRSDEVTRENQRAASMGGAEILNCDTHIYTIPRQPCDDTLLKSVSCSVV